MEVVGLLAVLAYLAVHTPSVERVTLGLICWLGASVLVLWQLYQRWV